VGQAQLDPEHDRVILPGWQPALAIKP